MLPLSDHIVDALSRIHRREDSRHATNQPLAVAVAITREAGSGGAEIARAVGAQLGWPVYDRELLVRIAEEKGLDARLLQHLDERYASWLEELFSGFTTQKHPTEGMFLKQLLTILVSLSKVGHCVIVGRGAGHVLPPQTTLHIRVIAPRAVRVARIEQQKGCSKEQAERWVDVTDADRVRFVKEHFHKDPNDALNYDLIVNSGRHSIEGCAALIVQAARLKQAKVEQDAAQMVRT